MIPHLEPMQYATHDIAGTLQLQYVEKQRCTIERYFPHTIYGGKQHAMCNTILLVRYVGEKPVPVQNITLPALYAEKKHVVPLLVRCCCRYKVSEKSMYVQQWYRLYNVP